MQKDILTLAKKFITIKSIPENPKGLEDVLDVALSELKNYTIEKFENNGVKSVLIYNYPKRPKKFRIILNGHLDVVPGKEVRYIPQIKGDKLYGVGSMDMKSNVACLIRVFNDVVEKIDYPLGLQLVTDEEIGGFNGTKYQVEKGVRADFVIAGEPTNFDIVNKAKGILWLKISSKGKTAHGAYPWRGDNAIFKMNNFLNDIQKKYPNPKKEKWVTTINLSQISTSNKSFNKIPDDCFVCLDIRHIPEEKSDILKKIKKDLKNENLKLEILADEPALLTNSNNEYLIALKKSGEKIIKKSIILRGAQGSSDARHYAKVKCPGIEFGPIGGDIGGDNEWVSIKSLNDYCMILEDFLLSLR